MKKEEKMIFQLAKLLFDYSANRKLVNRNYIKKLIEIIVEGRSLENYVVDYVIEDESKQDKSEYANYDSGSKIISLYLKGLEEYIGYEIKNINLFHGFQRFLYLNLITTQTMLHELEHANQQKIINEENGLESQILKLCSFKDRPDIDILVDLGQISKEEAHLYMKKKRKDYQRVYNESYSYAPHERLAEIKSFQDIITMLHYIKNTKKLIDYEETNKLENMLRGYEDTYSPTITYLNKQGRINDLEKFDWYSNNKEETIKLSKQKYNLKDRLKYGLPIDKEEYQYVKKIFIDMSL